MNEEQFPQEPEYTPQKKLSMRAFSLIISLVIVGLFGGVVFFLNKTQVNEEVVVVEQEETQFRPIFKPVDIDATAAIVWDVNARRPIFSKNSESQMPLASISKVMTALVAKEISENKELVITLKDRDLFPEGDNGLIANEKWRLSDLSDFMLVVSSNDGARAIASALGALKAPEETNSPELGFIDEMNKRAKELGLTQTYFLNESGLDIDEEYTSGSYGSAKDIALLFSYVLKNHASLLEATIHPDIQTYSEQNLEHNGENTNPYVEEVPRLIGSKTGFTDLAGGNLVLAFDAGLLQPYIVVVLGSDTEGRFTDALALVDATLAYVTSE